MTMAYLASMIAVVMLMVLEATLAEILVKWASVHPVHPVLAANLVMDSMGIPDRPDLMEPLVSPGNSDATGSSNLKVSSDLAQQTGLMESSGLLGSMDSMVS